MYNLKENKKSNIFLLIYTLYTERQAALVTTRCPCLRYRRDILPASNEKKQIL